MFLLKRQIQYIHISTVKIGTYKYNQKNHSYKSYGK